jgi:alcohol dehydrogenase class IV
MSATPEPFTYDALPGRVVFAPEAARERLGGVLDDLGARRVLAIFGESERPLAEPLCAPLEDRVAAVFTEVRPHVPVEVAQRARAAARDAAADAVLCIGGGSTTGTAKAVALESGLPIVAVPTTYAGSEVTPVWGMTEGQRKTTGTDAAVLPKVVVYDPVLTFSLPAAITGPSAMNAVAHCVEAFYAPRANPICSLMAEEGVRALAAGAPAAVERGDDLDARSLTLYGAYLAGAAFASAGSGLHHKICHALGGAFDLPHAEMHTIVLPYVMAFNEPAIPGIARRVAAALGPWGGDGTAIGLQRLGRAVGAPHSLRDIGLRDEDFDEAVAVVAEKIPHDNPRPVFQDDVRNILDAARAGAPVAAVGADGRSPASR